MIGAADTLTRIDVAVCTHRRETLSATLRSLDGLSLPHGMELRIIVADNDAEPTAHARFSAWAAETAHKATYVHAPAHNISIARNACLGAAASDWLAFIDDDEVASPGWITALLERARATGAAAVLGPVHAVYGPDAPAWMRRGGFHSTRPVIVRGTIRTGYTGNLFLRCDAPALQGLRFDPALGRSGGEDTAFLGALHRAGGNIAYAPRAGVSEVVPPERATFGWLARQRFRFGQSHGHSLAATQPNCLHRALQGALASAKGLTCGVYALVLLPSPVGFRRAALRGVLHCGVVASLAGVPDLQHYAVAAPREGG